MSEEREIITTSTIDSYSNKEALEKCITLLTCYDSALDWSDNLFSYLKASLLKRMEPSDWETVAETEPKVGELVVYCVEMWTDRYEYYAGKVVGKEERRIEYDDDKDIFLKTGHKFLRIPRPE